MSGLLISLLSHRRRICFGWRAPPQRLPRISKTDSSSQCSAEWHPL